jgi:hypothetical protein
MVGVVNVDQAIHRRDHRLDRRQAARERLLSPVTDQQQSDAHAGKSSGQIARRIAT